MQTDNQSNRAAEPLAYSVRDAARLSGLGVTSIYELAASGKLETRKVLGRRLVLARSLRALVEGEAA